MNKKYPKVDVTNFFKTVYKDRKMMKWHGFILSEHMEDINQVNYKNQDLTIRMDEMTETEMYALYQLAIKKNAILTIQKNILTIDNLQPLKSITGYIKGFNEVGLYLENEFIYFADIKCVTLSKDKKWSDLSKY